MSKRTSAPKDIDPGRLLTIMLIFPDGDRWIDQEPITGPLQMWLGTTKLVSNAARILNQNEAVVKGDLLRKGELHGKDSNGVEFLIKIDKTERHRNWGNPRSKTRH